MRFVVGLTVGLLVSITATALETGKPAPPITARMLNGDQFSLESARGQVVVINFWATWCAPCRKEMPALEAYYRKHRDAGLKVIAVSMDSGFSQASVREFMTDYSFPAAMQRDADFAGYGRIWRIPLTFVVDRKGILRRDGFAEEAGIDEADLEKTVTPLLKTK